MIAGLVVALAILVAHIRTYVFLTDDAYISFRYARNLAHGFGLVFNPGHERVEGYSNFLWTILLAGFDRLGWKPEHAANPLSIAATLATWTMVAAFAIARTGRERAWAALVAPGLLAITRSFAVWSTSGLETRWFEMLVVAGALRLVQEVEALLAATGERAAARPWPLAGLLFGLASLTRPDGLLLSGSAFAAAGAVLIARRRLDPGYFVRTLATFAILVGGHFAFRLAYYGHPWPNTYYAKVGGRTWWASGGRYFGAFALEYGVVLWIPLLVAAFAAHRARDSGFVPLLFASLIVPHALYIAAIGGDHFEYRPLDLYLPLVFLLLGDGVARWAGARGAPRLRTAAAVAYLGVVGLGIVWLPLRSHREFVPEYQSGFPGGDTVPVAERAAFLDPARDPLAWVPGMRAIEGAYVRLLRAITASYVGIRQEEHARFFALASREAARLRALTEQGILPRDLHYAVDCVGVIPYTTDFRVMDRLGLTDPVVARGPTAKDRRMAHEKHATLDYGRAQGVDLWPVHNVYSVWHSTDTYPIHLLNRRLFFYAAQVGEHDYLIELLPTGLDAAARRMPRLEFVPGVTDSFFTAFVANGVAAFRDSAAKGPLPAASRLDYAYLLILGRDVAAAARELEPLTHDLPDEPKVWAYLGYCWEQLGDPARAEQAKVEANAAAQRLSALTARAGS